MMTWPALPVSLVSPLNRPEGLKRTNQSVYDTPTARIPFIPCACWGFYGLSAPTVP